jgi:hypothetical protein
VATVLQLSDKTEPGNAVAVLRSSVVNQDGRSSSLTAPNGPSQTALVLQALEIAGAVPLLSVCCGASGFLMCLGLWFMNGAYVTCCTRS